MRDDFFNLKRFYAYLRKYARENMAASITRLLLLFATMLVITMWVAAVSYVFEVSAYMYRYDTDLMEGFVEFFYWALFFIVSCYWASQMMSGLSTKKGRIYVLTTPVTPFEGWLARWIIHVPCFWLAFTLCALTVETIRVAAFSPLAVNSPVVFYNPLDTMANTTSTFLTCLVCSSSYVFGSIFFLKRPLLKTTVVLFFLNVILAMSSNFKYLDSVFATTVNSGNTESVLNFLYSICVTVSLWWLSYRRYKELEVVDRL